MRYARIASAAVGAFALAACSTAADDPADSPTTTVSDEAATASAAPDLGDAVTVVTHDSFAVPDEVLAGFEAETGLDVTFVAPGDAGSLVNQLILTQDAPLGDVVYGVDNTFASRALDAGVFAPYTSEAPAAADAAQYAIAGSDALTAIDYSDVCLNIDLRAFGDELPAPETFEDLLDPAYEGLVSVTNPATSSPGLAFLMATVAAYGDDWPEYWAGLRDNDLRVTASWSDTYYVDFSGPNAGGDYPIVLSYASSPPYEVVEGEAATAALLDTCFRQVEYAGVLEGAQNPAGAQAVIDWMLSDEFQSALPEYMYVYPVSSTATIPAEWAEFAPLSDDPWSLDPATIDAQRDAWIATWTETVLD